MGAGTAPAVGGALAVVLGLATAVAHVGPGVDPPDGLTDFAAANVVTALAWGAVGALVLRARPGHLVGRLLLTIALAHGVTGLSRELGLLAYEAGDDGLASWLLWLGGWPFLLTLWFPLLLLLLPDGRPPGGRWRPLVLGAALAPLPIALYAALSPGPLLVEPLPGAGPPPENPLGLVDLEPLAVVSGVLFLVTGAAALASLVLRWRRGGDQRQQLKWVALAGALIVVGMPVEIAVPEVAPFVAPLAVTAFSAAIGLAVVRHRLLDVDLVISRTLLWAALTATLVGLYVTVVTMLGSVLRGSTDLLTGLIATALVAAAFAPLRSNLQRGVDRLFYGMRDDPYAVLRRVIDAVGTSPSTEDVLPLLGRTVATALRVPYAAVLLPDQEPVDPSGEVVDIPLRHGNQDVGRLVIVPRAGGERLNRADEVLLADLARQAAAAAHGVLLAGELRSSRDRVVAAREDERRRLRRDLHDGLGPLLAAVTVQLDAACRLLEQDRERAGAVLGEARREVQDAVADVRRIVDGLRPGALTALGLADAVRAMAGSLARDDLAVQVCAPDDLTLPPEVETAAYRIATEALTNAARHADASNVEVQLSLGEGELLVVVSDDGRGLPDQPRAEGVGLTSMRQRSEELGGSLQLVSTALGTSVHVRLPTMAATQVLT